MFPVGSHTRAKSNDLPAAAIVRTMSSEQFLIYAWINTYYPRAAFMCGPHHIQPRCEVSSADHGVGTISLAMPILYARGKLSLPFPELKPAVAEDSLSLVI
jgi:hypothetical protein